MSSVSKRLNTKLEATVQPPPPTDPLCDDFELTVEDESGSSESKFASGISLMSALFPFASSAAASAASSSSKTTATKGSSSIKFFTTGRAIPLDVASSIERVGVIPYVKFPVVQPQPFVKGNDEDDKEVKKSSGEVVQTQTPQTSSSSVMRFVPKQQQNPSLNSAERVVVDILSLHEEAGAVSRYWFAMAVDAQYGELTDCGGKRESCLEPIERTAVRELYEESMGVFDFRKRECEILNSHAITNGATCIFFVRVHPSDRYGFPYNLPSLFQKNKQAWFKTNSGTAANLSKTVSAASTVSTSLPSPIFIRGGSSPIHTPTPSARFRTRYIMSQQNQKRYPFRLRQNHSNRQDGSNDTPPPQPTATTTTTSSFLPSSSRCHNAFFENSCMYWIPGSDLEKILEIRTKKVNKKKYHISPIPFTRLSSNTNFAFNSETVFNETEIELSKLIQLEKETGRLPKKKLTFLTPTSPTKTKLNHFYDPLAETFTIKPEEDPAVTAATTSTPVKFDEDVLLQQQQPFPTSPNSVVAVTSSSIVSTTTIIKHPFMYETIRKLLLPVWSVFKEKL